MSSLFLVVAMALAQSTSRAVAGADGEGTMAGNPISRILTMLQALSQKVTGEGKQEQELFDKFMCYCETSSGQLKKSLADAEGRIPQLESSIAEGQAEKSKLQGEVEQAKKDLAEASASLNEGIALRKKEADAYAQMFTESSANIKALESALAALDDDKGSNDAFLQSGTASRIKSLSVSLDMGSSDRDLISAFLSQDQSYQPQSGEIVGILSQMKDTMEEELVKAKEAEEEAKRTFEEMSKAKSDQVAALTRDIKVKKLRIGVLSVEISNDKKDYDDTSEEFNEDNAMFADLTHTCEQQKATWEKMEKSRKQELTAIADTIRFLSAQDAVDLFKKTLVTSLLQVGLASPDPRRQALRKVTSAMRAHGHRDSRLSMIATSIRAKPSNFDKVVKMVEDMINLLQTEQTTDDDKQSHCRRELEEAEHQQTELTSDVSDLTKVREETKDKAGVITEELALLANNILELDQQVAKATAQRKAENDEFLESLSVSHRAKDLLQLAKEKLKKFYKPTLLQRASHARAVDTNTQSRTQRLAPMPEKLSGPKKNLEGAMGVIGLMDVLIRDIDEEVDNAKAAEKSAQQEYEKYVKKAAQKRASHAKAIADKEGVKAKLEATMYKDGKRLNSTKMQLSGVTKYLTGLHADCDWLLKHYESRQRARTNEIESLQQAKSILSGATSFLQLNSDLGGQHHARILAHS